MLEHVSSPFSLLLSQEQLEADTCNSCREDTTMILDLLWSISLQVFLDTERQYLPEPSSPRPLLLFIPIGLVVVGLACYAYGFARFVVWVFSLLSL